MSSPAVHAEGLGKRYRIGRLRGRHATLRETVSHRLSYVTRAIGSRLTRDGRPPPADDLFWALKDVSLDIPRGEVFGIIGANGAGKSTLLKILSRVTKPTTGYATIRGRVGSLLEVGTGFHPELTGRDNIYLNGAILGMKRSEIRRNFDQIVEFAEVAKFIDTPVKRYSSGMYLRLAFSVAAHLEPDLLLVDEVLAVGDAAFQRKCLGKMEQVAQQERTVLFVSHNMAALSNLCRTACRLDQGRLVDLGVAQAVIRRYLLEGRMQEEQDLRRHPGRKAGHRALLHRVRLLENGATSAVFRTNGPFELEVDCVAPTDELKSVSLGFLIRDSLGASVFASTMDQYDALAPNRMGHLRIRASIATLYLSPGAYTASLYLGNGLYDLDVIENAIGFDVLWEPTQAIPLPPGEGWGPVVVPVCWDWNEGQAPSPG
ncbi:MAG: ABC transporter ATP-binding protein [Gemmatimonadales bacterium]|nr:ABC transporter ATP-binding protein [Gemmatimonadales bacterium]